MAFAANRIARRSSVLFTAYTSADVFLKKKMFANEEHRYANGNTLQWQQGRRRGRDLVPQYWAYSSSEKIYDAFVACFLSTKSRLTIYL